MREQHTTNCKSNLRERTTNNITQYLRQTCRTPCWITFSCYIFMWRQKKDDFSFLILYWYNVQQTQEGTTWPEWCGDSSSNNNKTVSATVAYFKWRYINKKYLIFYYFYYCYYFRWYTLNALLLGLYVSQFYLLDSLSIYIWILLTFWSIYIWILLTSWSIYISILLTTWSIYISILLQS